jgi:hypothetical protein
MATSDRQARDPHAAPRSDAPRRSGYCTRISFLVALAWAVVTAVHGYATLPHIPMDISASDPATHAAFDAVMKRHMLIHAIVGLGPLLASAVLVSLVCRKQNRH